MLTEPIIPWPIDVAVLELTSSVSRAGIEYVWMALPNTVQQFILSPKYFAVDLSSSALEIVCCRRSND